MSLIDNTLYSLYINCMKKKKYIGIGIIILLIIIPLVISIEKQQQNQTTILQTNQKPNLPNQLTFVTQDSSFSPSSKDAITHEEITLESAQSDNSTIQKFVIKSPIDGSIRDLFLTDQPDLKFENITPNNWSPTNRFLFVYADYAGKRDVFFLKTDGKFTNGQYFLHSSGLYPDLTIINAQWIDTTALSLQTMNLKTHVPGHYVVNFDDDTGVMMPSSVYYSEYND